MPTEILKNKINYQFKLMYVLGMILIVSNHFEYGSISLILGLSSKVCKFFKYFRAII